MQNRSQSRRVAYFDYLRIYATFAVILVHASLDSWSTTDVNTVTWQIFSLFNGGARWAVPTFLMISGALFLEGKRSVGVILKKNVLRMLTAFAFWSAVYTIYVCRGMDLSLTNLITVFCSGHFHMWFVYVITGLYLAVPILRCVVESEKTMKYFLILALVFSSLIPFGATCIGIVMESGEYLIKNMLNELQLTSVTLYSFYFVLGYYLHKTDFSPVWRKRIYAAGIGGLIATLVLSAAASVLKQAPVSAFYEHHNLNVVCMSVAVFVYAKYHIAYDSHSEKRIAFVQKLSLYSFGAYLAHMLAIYFLNTVLRIPLWPVNPVLLALVRVVLAFGVSFAVSGILHHIPLAKKYIV